MEIKVEVSKKAQNKVKKLRLASQFEKQKKLFIQNPFHPSLDFKKIEPKTLNIYQFRINNQYRARLIKISEDTYRILVVGDFH